MAPLSCTSLLQGTGSPSAITTSLPKLPGCAPRALMGKVALSWSCHLCTHQEIPPHLTRKFSRGCYGDSVNRLKKNQLHSCSALLNVFLCLSCLNLILKDKVVCEPLGRASWYLCKMLEVESCLDCFSSRGSSEHRTTEISVVHSHSATGYCVVTAHKQSRAGLCPCLDGKP